jgi:hypothetical protein
MFLLIINLGSIIEIMRRHITLHILLRGFAIWSCLQLTDIPLCSLTIIYLFSNNTTMGMVCFMYYIFVSWQALRIKHRRTRGHKHIRCVQCCVWVSHTRVVMVYIFFQYFHCSNGYYFCRNYCVFIVMTVVLDT